MLNVEALFSSEHEFGAEHQSRSHRAICSTALIYGMTSPANNIQKRLVQMKWSKYFDSALLDGPKYSFKAAIERCNYDDLLVYSVTPDDDVSLSLFQSIFKNEKTLIPVLNLCPDISLTLSAPPSSFHCPRAVFEPIVLLLHADQKEMIDIVKQRVLKATSNGNNLKLKREFIFNNYFLIVFNLGISALLRDFQIVQAAVLIESKNKTNLHQNLSPRKNESSPRIKTATPAPSILKKPRDNKLLLQRTPNTLPSIGALLDKAQHAASVTAQQSAKRDDPYMYRDIYSDAYSQCYATDSVFNSVGDSTSSIPSVSPEMASDEVSCVC